MSPPDTGTGTTPATRPSVFVPDPNIAAGTDAGKGSISSTRPDTFDLPTPPPGPTTPASPPAGVYAILGSDGTVGGPGGSPVSVGGGILTSFQGRSTAAAVLTKSDVTGTGLAAADVSADASGAAASAVSTHVAATDPHGDRAYSNAATFGDSSLVATPLPTWFTSANTFSTNSTYYWLVAVRKTGTLHDLSIYLGTLSGNINVGVYDWGVTTGGVLTRLYASGNVATSGLVASAWNIIADPALAVTAGTWLALAVLADNGTVTIGRYTGLTGQESLPANFLTKNGVAPVFSSTSASVLPSSFTPASNNASSNCPYAIARVA